MSAVKTTTHIKDCRFAKLSQNKLPSYNKKCLNTRWRSSLRTRSK